MRPPLTTSEWRVERERQLKEPDGWLAIAGLFFLEPGINTVGTDPASDIVLPLGAGPASAGRIVLVDGAARLELNAGVAAAFNQEPIAAPVVLRLADTGQKRKADVVRLGRVTLQLHASGDRLAVRLRDPEGPVLRSFAGLRWFDIDESWRLTGRFVPYAASRTVTIQNILGDPEDMITPGEVEIHVSGRTVRLIPFQSGDRLWFVFRDATAGIDTYQIRFLYADRPTPAGRVTLDFNRAYNAPCAYRSAHDVPHPAAAEPPGDRDSRRREALRSHSIEPEGGAGRAITRRQERTNAMSKLLQEVLEANGRYAETFGEKASLGLPPARRFAILTCMDARLDPAKFAGLSEGDAHVIRNAGGRASDDAIRSLVISYKLLGTREWFVIHHTDCGMEFFTNDVMRGLLASSLETASLGPEGFKDVGAGPGSTAAEFIEWLTIKNQTQSVIDDVTRIRTHPLVPSSIAIYGYVYDVRTGRLVEVPEATKAGQVKHAARTSSAR